MSFVKVEINTNPIPSGVLEPKPFGYPSGGGGGGGGPVNFTLGGGSIFGNEGGGVVPAGSMNYKMLEFNRAYIGGKRGWGLLTIGAILPGPDPYPNQNHELIGDVRIEIDLSPLWVGQVTIGATAIRFGNVPVTVQKLFDTPAMTYPASVRIFNDLHWDLREPPYPGPVATSVQLNDMVFSIMEI